MADQNLSAFELFKALGQFEERLDSGLVSKSAIVDSVHAIDFEHEETRNLNIAKKISADGNPDIEERYLARFLYELAGVDENPRFEGDWFVGNARKYLSDRDHIDEIVSVLKKYDISPLLDHKHFSNYQRYIFLNPAERIPLTYTPPDVLIERLKRGDLKLPSGLSSLLETRFIEEITHGSKRGSTPDSEIKYKDDGGLSESVRLLATIGIVEDFPHMKTASKPPYDWIFWSKMLNDEDPQIGIFKSGGRYNHFVRELYKLVKQPTQTHQSQSPILQ